MRRRYIWRMVSEQEVIAHDSGTPDEVLLELLGHKKWHVRWYAAQNSGASDKVRFAALASDERDSAIAVADLGDARYADLVEAILAHPARGFRERLAQTSHDPVIIRRLASDPDARVRGFAAMSSACPTDVLRELAHDRRAEARGGVAGRPDCPADLLRELAKDKSANIRWAVVALHPRNLEVAEMLRDDPDATVRNQARQHLGLSEP